MLHVKMRVSKKKLAEFNEIFKRDSANNIYSINSIQLKDLFQLDIYESFIEHVHDILLKHKTNNDALTLQVDVNEYSLLDFAAYNCQILKLVATLHSFDETIQHIHLYNTST